MPETPYDGPHADADALASMAEITDEQRAASCAIPMTVEEFRNCKHPFQEGAEATVAAQANYRAERVARIAARRAASPTRILEDMPDDASHVFTQYRRTGQVSTAIRTVSERTGARFTSAMEYSLVDGSVIGVRVTRIVQK